MSEFLYVPQNSCIFYRPTAQECLTLYTDGAGAGILLALTGTDTDGQPLAALAHLTGAFRFRRFFQQVEQNFSGQAALTACGANPAAPVSSSGMVSYDAVMNVSTLLEWVTPLLEYPGKNLFPPAFCLSQAALQLGCGHNQLGLCINMTAKQPFFCDFTERFVSEREPVFLLASLFGVKTMLPSLILHEADKPFTKAETDALVWEARRERWETLISLSDEQLLQQFCAAPDTAPAWYASALRASAQYTADYGEIPDGIGRRAIQF